jgi:general secretion pathway protein J
MDNCKGSGFKNINMQNTAKGYTLLEMLISITLVGLLMTGLVVSVHVANKSWEKGEAKLRQVHAAEEQAQFMLQQIASLVPYKVASSSPDLPGDFFILEASATRLRFLSTYGTRYRSRAGLLWDEYAIVRAPRADYLLALRETPVRDDTTLVPLLIERLRSDPDTGKSEIVYRPFLLRESDLRLMTGLQAARFEYFGAPALGKEAVWASQWEATPEAPYPDAVRFLWRRDGQQHQLVIPIRARVLPK